MTKDQELKAAYERLNTAHNLVQASHGYFGFDKYIMARTEILEIFRERDLITHGLKAKPAIEQDRDIWKGLAIAMSNLILKGVIE